MSLKAYIRESKLSNFRIKNTQVFIKNKIPNILDSEIKLAVEKAFKKIPEFLLQNLDVIYIGDFQYLKDRKIQALFKDSSIFMTNQYESTNDMIDDIIHEVAHSVEEQYPSLIYSDGKIEKEFIQKRKQLWQILKSESHNYELHKFLQPDYDRDLDDFFYLEVGYPTIAMLTVNLFYSPYAVTSLREYFANGFEAFFMNEDVIRLKNVSPLLYNKLLELLNLQNRED